MRFYIILLFCLFFISCSNSIVGTYEIIEQTSYEKKIIKANIDSLKYYRKNSGTFFLTLKKDSTFSLKDISSQKTNFLEGKWKIANKKVLIYDESEGERIDKSFIINKNTLLSIQPFMLCDSSKQVNNVIFLTKTSIAD